MKSQSLIYFFSILSFFTFLIQAEIDTTVDYVILKRTLKEEDLKKDIDVIDMAIESFGIAITLNKTTCEKKMFKTIDPLQSDKIPEILKIAESVCKLPGIKSIYRYFDPSSLFWRFFFSL